MPNPSPVRKKLPWIPPPGRTRRQTPLKPTKEACIEIKQGDIVKGFRIPEEGVTFSIGLKQMEDVATAVQSNDPVGVKSNRENDNSDLASVSSFSSTSKSPPGTDIYMHSVKEEMKLLATHFQLVKQASHFLNSFFTSSHITDLTLKELLCKVNDQVKDFIFLLDDLEYSVALVQNTILQSYKTEECSKMLELKDKLLSNFLDCYSKLVTISQTLIQKPSLQEVPPTPKDQDFLVKQIKESEKKCASQKALIRDMENKLSILQGKNKTMEDYKSSLEDTKIELQKQLAYKDAQIKYLSTELSHLSMNPSTGDSDRLLEIIEEIRKNAQAEKTALKKALKVQKMQVGKTEEATKKLKKELKDQEKMMFNIASQRDQLKLHLTLANNSTIEAKTQIEEVKSQNLKLQNELCEKELNFKKQLQECSETSKEKSSYLDAILQEKNKLERSLEEMSNKLETTKKELESAMSKTSNSDALYLKNQPDGHGNASSEMKNLITLLSDTQENFRQIRNIPTFNIALGKRGAVEETHQIDSHNSFLTAIQEIKTHLIEIKSLSCVGKKEKNGAIVQQEGKLEELQESLSLATRENEALKSELEQMKCVVSQIPRSENYHSSYVPENEFSVRSLQMELKLNTEENWRLKHREKDLERQLKEVKDKLQKKEIENFRLFSLEEELKSRKDELALLEKRKQEESDKLLNRIKELQETLDKTTADYENLKRYVQLLKSSYLNVFGGS